MTGHRFEDIREGDKHRASYTISNGVYSQFMALFEDRNPLHVDAAYARSQGFADKVMHGAILNGFLSHFIGMNFPGKHAMLLSADLRFVHPCYLGDTVELSVQVRQKVDSQRALVLLATFKNETRRTAAARGEVAVKVLADGV